MNGLTLLSVFLAAAAVHSTVTLDLEPSREGIELPPLTVELHSAAGTDDVERLRIEPHAAATIDLPAGSHWTVRSGTPGWWIAPDLVNADGRDGAMRRLRVWPIARVHARVAFAAGVQTTTPIRVAVSPTPAVPRSTLPDFSDVCSLKAGALTCELPEATADLAFRIPGAVPVYRWGVRLDRAHPLDLGRVEFKRGASVSGWVEPRESAAGARATLARRAVSASEPAIAERLARPVADVAVARNGFFQLAGVPKGTYELRVQRAGHAPAVLFPVAVEEGAETRIKAPLVLRPPITVRARIDPALTPSQKAWRVAISRISETSGRAENATAFSGMAGGDGLVEVARQAPGEFQITVYDEDNPLYHGRFTASADGDAPSRIEIHFVSIHGRVHRGGEPMPGRLTFGGKFGAVHVIAEADEKGEYVVTLPRSGKWVVDVDPVDAPASRSELDVPDDTDSRIDISLNANSVRGVVLDEKDEPASNANVSLVVGTAFRTVRASADGSFAFSSVPAGEARLSASRGDRERLRHSNVVTLPVAEDSDIRNVQLHLSATSRIVGELASPYGPVAGAAVTLFSQSPSISFRQDFTADMEGRFAFDAPAGLSSAIAVVASAGLPLRAFEVPLDGRLLVLTLPAAGGTLRLHRPASFPATGEMLFLLTQDDRPLPTDALFRWARGHGLANQAQSLFVIPEMAPANYRLCIAMLSTPDDRVCASGVLPPHGELDLTP